VVLKTYHRDLEFAQHDSELGPLQCVYCLFFLTCEISDLRGQKETRCSSGKGLELSCKGFVAPFFFVLTVSRKQRIKNKRETRKARLSHVKKKLRVSATERFRGWGIHLNMMAKGRKTNFYFHKPAI
jgi:hypothetical protein